MPFVKVDDGGLLYEPMKGEELRAARNKFCLSKVQFGYLIGMTGENKNICTTIKRYEQGRREIGPMVERLVTMLRWFYDERGHLPDLDRGQQSAVAERFDPDQRAQRTTGTGHD